METSTAKIWVLKFEIPMDENFYSIGQPSAMAFSHGIFCNALIYRIFISVAFFFHTDLVTFGLRKHCTS